MKRSDPAFQERPEEKFFRYLTIYRCQLEMPRVFPREFPDDFQGPMEVWPATGMTCRPHDHRDTGVKTLAYHDSEIAFGGFARPTRISGAQVIGSRVRGTSVTANKVCALLHGADEGLFSESRAQVASG